MAACATQMASFAKMGVKLVVADGTKLSATTMATAAKTAGMKLQILEVTCDPLSGKAAQDHPEQERADLGLLGLRS